MSKKILLTVGCLAAALILNRSLHSEEISAQGSDSTLHLVKELAAEFEKETGIKINLHGGGSSAGAKECMAGNVQLAFLSRKLKDKETDNGLVGVSYALDGVAVIVNKNNPVDNITLDTLKKIYTGEMKNWDDGKPVLAFNRNTDSGTREVFSEKVLGKGTDFDQSIQIKHDTALLPTVSKAVTAIGYTSAGEVDENKVKVLKVEGVYPDKENIRADNYPIARTLTFATKGEALDSVKQFIDFVLGAKGKGIIQAMGYVTLED